MQRRFVVLTFLSPAVGVVVMTVIYPLLFALRTSFHEWNLTRSPTPGEFVGLKNYARAFADPGFLNSVVITAEFVFISVGLTVVIGLAMALLLQKPGKFNTVLKTILIFPFATAPLLKGYSWRFMVNPEYGIYDKILDFLFPPLANTVWLSHKFWALFTIALSEIWGWAPIVALMFIGALGSISPEIFEAAKVDGATNWQLFWRVTLPLLWPVVVIVILLKSIYSVKIFDQVVAMTGGGPGRATQTLNFFVYHVAFRTLDMGYASALAYILLVVMAIFAFLYVRALLGKEA